MHLALSLRASSVQGNYNSHVKLRQPQGSLSGREFPNYRRAEYATRDHSLPTSLRAERVGDNDQAVALVLVCTLFDVEQKTKQ